MKDFNCSFLLCLLSLVSIHVFSQCTPVNCMSMLPPYGGICDSSVMFGRVNQYYDDFISFNIGDACIDAGSLDSQYTGIGAKMLKLHTISFSGLPAGLTGVTNQTEYNAPAIGCGSISGTPTEAGEFEAVIHILANARTWPFSTSCSGFFPIDQNDQPFDGKLSLLILPDPSFTGLDSTYCFQDSAVALTPTGSVGGIFSGSGVTGNIFDPSLAGTGTHEIKYIVSAQEGVAVGPATDSSVFIVTVTPANVYYADSDGDGFGDPNSIIEACSLPIGFIANNLDCNDTIYAINPDATDIPDNDIDEDCSGADSTNIGIHEIQPDKFRIYPNPANDHIIIESSVKTNDIVIYIYTIQGVLQLKQNLRDKKMILDISHFAKGVYYVLLLDNNNNNDVVRKILKK